MDKSFLLGLGLDTKDGQKRVTLGENYKIYGGSKQTHEMMQEKCAKLNEQLKKKGKTLDQVTQKEFLDMAHKTGFKIPKNKRF